MRRASTTVVSMLAGRQPQAGTYVTDACPTKRIPEERGQESLPTMMPPGVRSAQGGVGFSCRLLTIFQRGASRHRWRPAGHAVGMTDRRD
jgi:hypothetical protein